jgi:hypothetical protein
MRDLLWASPEG